MPEHATEKDRNKTKKRIRDTNSVTQRVLRERREVQRK